MKILVFNSGSSSIKYSLYEMDTGSLLADGVLEQIGDEDSSLRQVFLDDTNSRQEICREEYVKDHREGLKLIREVLSKSGVLENLEDLDGIGHRVVHGAEDFADPVIITQEVVDCIRENIPLAPLHNPANLLGIEVTLAELPSVPQVAVFDTAFHQSLPPVAYNYALPYELYSKHKIRRYGFHGTSHSYVARKAADFLGKTLEEVNLIILHLGNGASACAVKGGRSVDTSMGMTPLEGLIMGTRCGDIDPGILFHLGDEENYTTDDLDQLLNKQSGLKGICVVNDMRDLLELVHEGDEQARLALDMTCYRIKKYIGAYFAVLGRVDAVVFTAGIGENSPEVRAGSCSGLEGLGISIDQERNTTAGQGCREIQDSDSKVKVLVVPTDEELEIAEAVQGCIEPAEALL